MKMSMTTIRNRRFDDSTEIESDDSDDVYVTDDLKLYALTVNMKNRSLEGERTSI